MSWWEIIAQWELLEFSFHSALGVDLEDVWRSKSWRWFTVRVHGLLSSDTPLARHFIPADPEPTDTQGVTDGDGG